MKITNVHFFNKHNKCYIARTQWDSPIIDNSVMINDDVKIGTFNTVKIVDASEYDLRGVVIN